MKILAALDAEVCHIEHCATMLGDMGGEQDVKYSVSRTRDIPVT